MAVRAWVKLGLRSAEVLLRHGAEAAREVIGAIDRDTIGRAVDEFREEFHHEQPVTPDREDESERDVEPEFNIPPTPSPETLAMLAPPAPAPVQNEPGKVQVNR